jgi:hypothetical protein
MTQLNDNPYKPPEASLESSDLTNAELPLMWSRQNLPFLSLLSLIAGWHIAMPFIVAYNVNQTTHVGYWLMLSFYIPQLIVGGIVMACLPIILKPSRIAVIGLVFAAVLSPILEATIVTAGNIWPISLVSLLLLSWRLHLCIARRAYPDSPSRVH